MKKFFAAALAMMMILSLAACGGKKADEPVQAPDLNAYVEDFLVSLGEGNAPALMSISEDADLVEGMFPGLGEIELNQTVLQLAAISAVGFEMDLVECAKAEDVETVKAIFQTRVDNQVAGGAFYPAVGEAWENASIIVNGNVVALIVAGEAQDAAVEAFNALFN